MDEPSSIMKRIHDIAREVPLQLPLTCGTYRMRNGKFVEIVFVDTKRCIVVGLDDKKKAFTWQIAGKYYSNEVHVADCDLVEKVS